jgi:phosphoribosylformylglycinamidine (FGAM) synthase-like amidotransferase family enzyme
MVNFESFSVQEMNTSEITKINGGFSWEDYLVGKAIDSALECMKEAFIAYVNYSASTGGKYVIHHAQ